MRSPLGSRCLPFWIGPLWLAGMVAEDCRHCGHFATTLTVRDYRTVRLNHERKGKKMSESYEAWRVAYQAKQRPVAVGRRCYDCPDCGAKGVLSAWEKQQRYHCWACTRGL